MRRVYTMAVPFLAFTLVISTISWAQREDRTNQGRTASRGDEASNAQQMEQLWQQIAQLHKQIVALEVTGIDRSGQGQDQQRAANRSNRNDEDEDERSAPDRSTLESSFVGGDADALWKRVAQVHRQLVAMEVRRSSGQMPATQLRTDRTGPAGRDAANATRANERPSESRQNRQNDLQTNRGSQGDLDENPLLSEYARLHSQIIRQDVQLQITSSGRSTFLDRPSSADEPTSRR